jgi:hypothetical protein
MSLQICTKTSHTDTHGLEDATSCVFIEMNLMIVNPTLTLYFTQRHDVDIDGM